MDTFKLEDFTKGWLVGDFEPSLIRSKDIEVAVRFIRSMTLNRDITIS